MGAKRRTPRPSLSGQQSGSFSGMITGAFLAEAASVVGQQTLCVGRRAVQVRGRA